MRQHDTLSIIIPVRNEAENILQLHEEILDAIKKTSGKTEIIYVDDASTDESRSLIQTFAHRNPFVRLIAIDTHSGQSIALAAGIQNAKGAYIVTLDADQQNDPRDIPAFLACIKKGYDAVCGIRMNRQDTLSIRVASFFGFLLRQLLFSDGIRDSGCTLRIYRSDILKTIPLKPGYHRLIPTVLSLHGYRIAQIPVRHRKRRFGTSNYTLWKVFPAFRDLLVLYIQQRLRKYRTLAITIVIPCCLFLYFLLLYLPLRAWNPFMWWDEARWIGRSVYWELYKNGDFSNPLWHNQLAYDQPMVGNYYYGIMLRTTPEYLIDRNMYVFNDPTTNTLAAVRKSIYWGRTTGYREDELLADFGPSMKKTVDVILYARTFNAAVNAVTAVLVYFLMVQLFGFGISFLTTLVYGHNILTVQYGLIAQSETPFLFLFFLGLLLLSRIVIQKKHTLPILGAFSAVAALLSQTKLNGWMLTIIYVVFMLFCHIRTKRKEDISFRYMGLIIGIPFIIFGGFITLDPTLYQHPIRETKALFNHRLRMSEEQARESPAPLNSILSRALTIQNHTIGLNNTGEFYSFFLPTQRYPYVLLHPFALAFFIIAGMFVAAKKALYDGTKTYIFFIVSYSIVYCLMCLYMSVDWSRYYLPLAFFYHAFFAIGIRKSITVVWTYLQSKIPHG